MNLINSKTLTKNVIFNFIGQIIPIAVMVITMPFIIKGLGTARFGFLSIVWVIIGNFAVFDLGLGRAVNKFVAEAIGRGNKNEIPQIIWTALTVQVVFGIIGGVVFAAITPFLVTYFLKIPHNLITEAKTSLYLLAPSIPILLVTASLSGVLSAYQRFDLINAIKIPISSLTYIILLVCVFLKFNLPDIVIAILLIRLVNLIIFAIFNVRLVPAFKKYSVLMSLVPRLFSYGGWIMVSNVVGPILVYLNTLLVGSILSMSSVAFYSMPYEAITRLSIISSSLTMVLFPAFSTLQGIGDKKKLGELFMRSIKYIILISGVISLIVILFAKDILQLWLGNDFAVHSTLSLQILSIGVLINSIALIPYNLIQGIGRPDLTAKFHLIELPLYIVLAWLLIVKWGIAGAAAAWTLRILIDAVLLFVVIFKIYKLPLKFLKVKAVIGSIISFAALSITVFIVKSLLTGVPLLLQIITFGLLLCVFIWFCWKYLFDSSEHEMLSNILNYVKAK